MYQSIVAVYSRLPDADALRRELEDAGIPASRLHISTEDNAQATTGMEGRERRGFLDWLFGVPENDMPFYRDSLERGRTIVKVHIEDAQAEKVPQVLDRYGPIDVDSERDDGAVPTAAMAAGDMRTGAGAARTGETESEARIPVAEEEMRVGKRTVERGRVRVRSYVVEQPFEELVRLRDETVRVERRPASGEASATGDAFQERSFEVRERDEEPVVEKRARVKEEVVVGKDVDERTERIRDKVRRTQVDIEKEPEAAETTPPRR